MLVARAALHSTRTAQRPSLQCSYAPYNHIRTCIDLAGIRQLEMSPMMFARHRAASVSRLLATACLIAAPAFGQPVPADLPDPKIIANADKFEPPRLTEYAARLARQPDMTGTWMAMVPKGAGNGPTFDPVHTFYPPALAHGEATFGPLPGTYIKGIPYNPEYQKKYAALIKETTEGKSRDTFPACVPYGVRA